MPQPVDPHTGQGGSYIKEADGTRRLVFRTGLGPIEPPQDAPVAPEPVRKPLRKD